MKEIKAQQVVGLQSPTQSNAAVNKNYSDTQAQTVSAGAGVWHTYQATYSDLAAAATSNDIELFSLPAGGVIHDLIVTHSTAFAGGSLSAYNVSVGVSGELDKYALAYDVFQAVGNQVADSSNALGIENKVSSTSIRLAATSVGANLNSATQGVVVVYVRWSVINNSIIGGTWNLDSGVVALSAQLSGVSQTPGTNISNFNGSISDTMNGFNPVTGIYTVQKAGWYDISGSYSDSGTGESYSNLSIVLTGSQAGTYVGPYFYSFNTIGVQGSMSLKKPLVPGDTISLVPGWAGTGGALSLIDVVFSVSMIPNTQQTINGQVVTAQFLGSIKMSGGIFSTTSPTLAGFPASSGFTYTTTGVLQAPPAQIPGFVIPTLEPGAVMITSQISNGGWQNSSPNNGSNPMFAYSDGTQQTIGYTFGHNTGYGTPTWVYGTVGPQTLKYATTQSNLFIQLQGADPNGGTLQNGSPLDVIEFDVFYFPYSPQQNSYGVPAGSILPFGGTTAPGGFLMCDGTSYSNASYPNLFSAIGTAYGAADGSHFNVPDLRGNFLRGTDHGAGQDPDAASRTALNPGGNTGDAVGSYEADQFSSHSHSLPGSIGLYGNPGGSGVLVQIGSQGTGAAGGSETRPKNVGVNYIIKY